MNSGFDRFRDLAQGNVALQHAKSVDFDLQMSWSFPPAPFVSQSVVVGLFGSAQNFSFVDLKSNEALLPS